MAATWVKPTRDEVAAMRTAGMTWAQIGERYGVHRKTFAKWAHTLGLPVHLTVTRNTTVTPEEIRRLVVEKQYSDRALATHLGLSVASAQRRRLRAGVGRDKDGKAVQV